MTKSFMMHIVIAVKERGKKKKIHKDKNSKYLYSQIS